MGNKVALITGGSSGIGKALVYEYASRGYNIAFSARRGGIIQEIAKDIENKYPVQALAVETDLSVEEGCRKFVEASVEKFGRIDVLINNAGISQRALFKNISLTSLHKVMDINYWGTVNTTKFALPYVLESKGSIVAVSSISGFSPLPARTAYCSSKYAIHGFLEALRIEHLKDGLHVMIAAPEYTATEIRKRAVVAGGGEQGESPRDETKMLTPEYVARRIAKGVDKRKRNLIIGRLGRVTVWFSKCFPKWSDKLIYNYIKKEANSPF